MPVITPPAVRDARSVAPTLVLTLVLTLLLAAAAQENALHYTEITGGDRREGGAQHMNVVGSRPNPDPNHGHVVLQSNKRDRVWDGNSIVRLKESLERIKSGKDTLADDKTEHLARQRLLTDVLSPGHYRAAQNSGKNGVLDASKLLDKDDLRAITAQLDTEKLLAIYSADGNRPSLSWKPSELKNVKWFRSSQPLDIQYSRKIFADIVRGSTGNDPLSCNQLLQKILKDDRLQGQRANEIDSIIKQDAKETSGRLQRESKEPRRETDYHGDKDKPVIGKPGGAILSVIAQVEGFKAGDIQSVTFDRSMNRLDFQTRDSTIHSFPIDPDDFAVVVRSVFFKNIDPVLSMDFDPNKPGYYSIEYSGDLYRTHVGKVLFDADSTLGSLVFNADSDEYAIASDLLPRYEKKVKQGNLLARGGRTYLLPTLVQLRVAGDELQEQKVELMIEVELGGWGAWYVQKQLAELAQYLTANMNVLTESFESFERFRELSAVTGLVKWLHENSVPTDFGWVRDYKPREEIFPSYVPADTWQFLYTGTDSPSNSEPMQSPSPADNSGTGNLDGWQQTTSPDNRTPWQIANGMISVTAAGSESERLYFEHSGKDYDVSFLIHVINGKANFVVRTDANGEPVLIPLPAEGWLRERIKFTKGKWTLFVEDEEKSSAEVSIPQAESSTSEAFGFIAGSNSSVEIASVRYRQPY